MTDNRHQQPSPLLVCFLCLSWAFWGACSSPQGPTTLGENDGNGSRDSGGQGFGATAGGSTNSDTAGSNAGGAGSSSSSTPDKGDSLSGSNGSGGSVSPGGSSNLGSGGRARALPDLEFPFNPDLDIPRETCANSKLTARPLPLDMYIILDRTGSMRDGSAVPGESDCDIDVNAAPSSASKWCKAINALGKYFTSDAATGHRAALQFMQPGDSVECSGPDNTHSTPAVDLTLLPEPLGTSGGLVDAMNAAVSDAVRTEIESALNGLVDFTLANQTGARKMIGILVTDGGAAGSCEENVSLLAPIPRAHFQDSGIPTFIIGMTGAPYEPLQEIAVGSGGPGHDQFCDPEDTHATCHYWSVGNGDPTAFVAALDAIEESAIGCEFSVPSPDQGLVDLDTVMIQFTKESMGPVITLDRSANLADCTDDQYYTVQLGDHEIIKLCPTTCAQLGPSSEIEVEVQCSGT